MEKSYQARVEKVVAVESALKRWELFCSSHAKEIDVVPTGTHLEYNFHRKQRTYRSHVPLTHALAVSNDCCLVVVSPHT